MLRSRLWPRTFLFAVRSLVAGGDARDRGLSGAGFAAADMM
jgi:hypothetical protein